MHTNINVENLSSEIVRIKKLLCECCNKELDESKFCNHCQSGEHTESLKTEMKIAGQKFHLKTLTNCFIYGKKYPHSKEYYETHKTVEEKPRRCSCCGGDGYYDDGFGNDCKCDHCKGSGVCESNLHNQLCDECV